MQGQGDNTERAADERQALRRRAEARVRGNWDGDVSALSPEEIGNLFHELRVHQVELEMQNEELREAQAALEESRARYFDLYDLAPVGYLTLGEHGLILEANLAAAAMLGVTRSVMVDVPLSRYIVKEDQDTFYRHRQLLFETGEPQVCEVRVLVPGDDAATTWVRLEENLARGADGARVWRVTLSDITERKRIEARLRRMMAELTRSNEDLESFAYVASHDLQEPLRTIASFVNILASRYQGRLDAEADTFISYVVDSAKRMQQLLTDLREYSRVGRSDAPLTPTDLGAVCQAAIRDLGAAISESGATVVCDELPTVHADAAQMEQVFLNLISNALKFRGAEPSRVHIFARRISSKESGSMAERETQRTQHLSSRTSTPSHAPAWLISVRDNGIGIAPQHFERIFVIFNRLHTRDEYPGTGLGLTICKRIVERHGGRIWVESTPGLGSTFNFTLPASSVPLSEG